MKKYLFLILILLIATAAYAYDLSHSGADVDQGITNANAIGALTGILVGDGSDGFTALAIQETEAFTTESDLSISSRVVLLDGDNDTDNDVMHLQDGSTNGQELHLIAATDIDADDTVTIDTSTDTTCTNCPAIVFDTIGENAKLVWTGSTWVVVSLQDAY